MRALKLILLRLIARELSTAFSRSEIAKSNGQDAYAKRSRTYRQEHPGESGREDI